MTESQPANQPGPGKASARVGAASDEPPRTRQSLGARGEEIAARQLEAAGLEILDRNWRCSRGELNVVAREGTTLVVCEVKTRSGLRLGTPLEAVGTVKAAQLRQLAQRWLTTQHSWFDEVRFDVVGVLCSPGGPVSVEHVRGVC